MKRARWGMILAGLMAALPPTSAQANDKATRDAQARFVEGIARVKNGDFEAARLSFAQAYTVLRKPDILWNLALAEEKSGHVVEALAHFRELGRDGSASEDGPKAKKHVDALMAQTGHIEVVAPSGMKVNVDGEEAGVAPLADPVDVLPGKHHVAAGEKATVADVNAGEVVHVSFLVAEVPAPAVTPAAPAATASEPAPSPPPRETPAPREDTSESTARAVTVIAVGTLAVAGGVLGIAFGLSSQSNANTAEQLRGGNQSACNTSSASPCAQLKEAVDAENRDHTLSTAFYVTGGALAAGALATWLFWPKHATAPAASIAPTLGPTGCGVGLAGMF